MATKTSKATQAIASKAVEHTTTAQFPVFTSKFLKLDPKDPTVRVKLDDMGIIGFRTVHVRSQGINKLAVVTKDNYSYIIGTPLNEIGNV